MSADFYNKNAQQLADMYLSKTFETVHQSWLEHLTPVLNKTDARILDLGAGAGRDSRYLAQQGAENNIQVTAIEPAQTLAEIGKQQTQGLSVHWLQDALPDLNSVTKLEVSFDLILLSAVWMHIPVSQRERSLRKLANLLKPGGKLVISLRHGPDCKGSSSDAESNVQRRMFTVCSDELIIKAKSFGLSPILVTDINKDVIGRDEITWQTVVLQLSSHHLGSENAN